MFDFFKRKRDDNKSFDFKPNENWTKVSNKAVKDYYSLNSVERIWFNCRVIIDSTKNGGLISYYYNSGAENVYDAVEDIKALGFENIASIIQKYNIILFKGSEVPTDINKRNEYINDLDERTDELLQNLETELTKLLNDLEISLETYLKKEKMID
jgi:hypothetical protein